MQQALAQANAGRLHILDKMAEALGTPREKVANHAPKYTAIKIHQDKIRDIIGPGGKVIRELSTEFDAKIDVEDDGTVKLFTANGENGEALLARIKEMTAVPEVGVIYDGLVRSIKEYGAFVEILPGTDGMVHISELAPERVKNVTDILSEGDRVKVKVIEIDNRGRIRLSRKAALDEE
jgi:polyribonucleotide nucleotidyltransferase